jgi:hypothetical protein
MRSRRSVPEHATAGTDSGRDAGAERSRLVTALRGADLDTSPLDSPLDASALDDTRTVLMARLMRHSNDFAATTALKALDTFTAATRANAVAATPDRVLRQGQSGTRTARRWLHLGGAA